MDLYFQLCLLLVLLFTPLFLFLFSKPSRAGAGPHHRLPPGNTGWPIVGETLTLFLRGRSGNPEKFIRDRMEQHSSKVFKTSLFGVNMAVLCGAAGNKFVFSNENKVLAFWWPQSVNKVLSLPPVSDFTTEESRKLRSILSEFLKHESLRNYVAIMDWMAMAHLEKHWLPYTEVQVHPLSKDYSFAVAMRVFLSLEDPDHVARILEPFMVVREGLVSVPVQFPGTKFSRAVAAGKVVQKELLEVIRRRKAELVEVERRGEVAQDLLTRMLLANELESGKFTNDMEIAGLIIGFLLAGHDTASAAITAVMGYLAELPLVYDGVHKGIYTSSLKLTRFVYFYIEFYVFINNKLMPNRGSN